MPESRNLQQLVEGLVGEQLPAVSVSSVALDSRQVTPGCLFIALARTQVRGHDFIPAAIKAGAVAIVYESITNYKAPEEGVPCFAVESLNQKAGIIAERFYAEPTKEMFVVGVTGTNGKTSCSHFLAQAFHSDATPCCVVGTLGNGLWGALDTATHTTPDAVGLHGLMRNFSDENAKRVVMEVSSHGLDQGRVAGVSFDAAVFTNLSRDHLDYHGDMQAYGEAKARLFNMPNLRYAVVNGDDEFGRQLIDSMPASVELFAYSMELLELPENIKQITGKMIACDRHGLKLNVVTPWGEGEVTSSLLGRFNASNLLAVLGVLLVSGMSLDEALQKLSQIKTAPGRMEHFGGDQQPLVVIDYAHTPDALNHVLTTLRDHCDGQLWLVFGCGGDRDVGKRPLMGAAAEQLADHIVLTDDNPRHENPDKIVNDILAGIKSVDATVIRDRADAIAFAVKNAAVNDVVLVAGKGHEDYQQVGDEKLPFSDREQVEKLLGEAA